MAAKDNSTFDVVGYVDKEALPLLENELGVVRTLDNTFDNWEKAYNYGTRGPTVAKKLPTRLNADDGLDFDQDDTDDGAFNERRLSISADQLANSRYAYTNIEEATFDTGGLLNTNAQSAINELSNKMDRFAAESVSLRGYRFFGDFNVQTDQMQTVGEVTTAVARFRSFGCARYKPSFYLTPFVAQAKITQSGLQQFVMKRNEELAVAGEIGELKGVPNTNFIASNLLPIHTSGTAADTATNFSTGYGIAVVAVTPPDNSLTGNQAGITTLDLTGFTPGDTIVVNDAIDIGFLNTADPLLYLTFSGYNVSENKIQGRVIVGGTADGGGLLQIQIEPALIFDAANSDPQRNLNRAIDIANDTLRIAKSHRAAGLYIGDYGCFASPKLAKKDTYDSHTVRATDTGVSLRAYYGDTKLGTSNKYMVHDVIYGFGGAAEGFGRVMYPIE